MEIVTPADHLWFTTAHLEGRGSKGITHATGFFYAVNVRRHSTNEEGPVWFLITNRHVVEAARDRLDIGLIKGEVVSGTVTKPVLGERVGIELRDPSPSFRFHPEKGIDVAVLPFNKHMHELTQSGAPPMLLSVGPGETLTAEIEEELDSLEQILVVGYPAGLYDRHNLTPIMRTGYTASPIRIDYGGRQTFLIDAPIFPGSSGSPVFLMERMGQVAGALGASGRVVLLGVVAEAQTFAGAAVVRGQRKPKNSSTLMDLGIVFKASVIDECVDAVLEEIGATRS
jgi:trypsin-like peptidase